MPNIETELQNKIEEIKSLYTQKKDASLIANAYALAQDAHKNQKRESGEPYILHPLSTALTLARMNMDAQTIAAALLHDVVDDTPLTLAEIKNKFGEDVAFLVDGVSKLGKIKYRGAERHAENLRKMLISMAQDVRVILIKFADRLHNIQTLDALSERKRKRIALETLEIYVPIAMRLGVNELARELEDLAFPHIYPEKYEYIKRERKEHMHHAEKYMKKLLPTLKKELIKENLKPKKVEIRAKHYYSLWRKLEKNNYNWSKIYDLIAIRIMVDTVEECYKTLGIIHKLWRPLPGRIKDYIALPKPNGYQSLHTTVFCLEGRITEIQIRTKRMHENAEYGIASHWRYKNRGAVSKKEMNKNYKWVGQLREWKKDSSPTEEFLNSLKIDVFGDRIFVFTPKGAVFDLPQGATTVDFAYTVHSDIGDKCAGAMVNGKFVALNYELHNGDVVEIITSKNKTPSQAWLGFVKTRNAKTRIRRWFKEENREQNLEMGLDILNEEVKSLTGKTWAQTEEDTKKKILERFSVDNEENLFLALGQGDVSINRVVQGLIDKDEKIEKETPQKIVGPMPVAIAGTRELKMHIAQCCSPTRPEEIAAYITVDKGASIHRANCLNLRKVTKSEKILPAYWLGGGQASTILLELLITNRVGMLEDISRIVASLNINIRGLSTDTKKYEKNTSMVKMRAKFEVSNLNQLKILIEKLKTIDGVIEVKRAS